MGGCKYTLHHPIPLLRGIFLRPRMLWGILKGTEIPQKHFQIKITLISSFCTCVNDSFEFCKFTDQNLWLKLITSVFSRMLMWYEVEVIQQKWTLYDNVASFFIFPDAIKNYFQISEMHIRHVTNFMTSTIFIISKGASPLQVSFSYYVWILRSSQSWIILRDKPCRGLRNFWRSNRECIHKLSSKVYKIFVFKLQNIPSLIKCTKCFSYLQSI